MIPILAIALAAAAPQTAPLPAANAAPDYSHDAAWLCRPGREDACAQDLTTTVIAADGSRRTEPFVPAASPAFDCFYVYPTVSRDPTPNSDMVAGPEEHSVAHVQAERFKSVCRVFAPMYRQITLTALRELMVGGTPAMNRAMAYDDVKAAWDDYLKRDNGGRGVVLIGHSQGSFVLKDLIAREIDGKPVQARIISAMLIGANVGVPAGKDAGGDFKSMPLCRSNAQSGCVVSYVSFRADAPPPANSRFGKADLPGMVAACTNPAALGGGKAATRNYLTVTGTPSAAPTPPWTSDGVAVTTPFVSAPGLLSTECASAGGYNYLAVTVNGDPAGARTDAIGGDVMAGGTILKDWGLHLIDMDLAMGDLVALADSQAKGWAAKRRH
jgi:hypothetical protein